MQTLLARRNRMFAGPGKGRRRLLAGVDLVLWGVPLAMILVAGVLIASTQREANYADWYQHWITAAVGLGISNLVRPLGALPSDEEQLIDVTAMLRGGGQLAVPIRNNQGVVLGVHAAKFFSRKQVVAHPDPAVPDAPPDANPFDLVLEIGLGYQMWF